MKSVRVGHEVIHLKPLTIFVDDDGTGLAKPKKAFRSTQNASR